MTPTENHILSYRALLGVLGILITLTGVTILVSRLDVGWLNTVNALLIATIKSSFVLLYFMHLKYENRIILWTFMITVCVVAILVGFLFWDIAYRYP